MNKGEPLSKQRLPGIAIVANSLPPYRLHLHRRIVREMGNEIIIHTVCTHEVDYLHPYAPTPDINAVSFGPGHPFTRQLKLRYAGSEWLKAGRIISWLEKKISKPLYCSDTTMPVVFGF